MASPFYSSYWNQPSEPLKRKPETPSPKVISIPVHFVDSTNNRSNSGLNRSDAALMIQKVFRGFLLRKSVKKIVSIKNEVEDIERRIAKTETVELIRMDSKERLRINETLMALLFKLDSIRGIDSGVRDLRKRVIRKAIVLQENVDAIVMQSAGNVDSRDQEMSIENPPAANSTDNVSIENVIESMDQSKDDEEEANCVVKEIVEDCNAMNCKTEMQKQDDEEMDDCCKGVRQESKEETGEVTRDDNDNDNDNEKMICEEAGEKKSNEEMQTQMIRMMSELVEKNELQTKMINSLTHRVGQLEKAFLCDKLRRSNKKKRRQHDADGKQQ